MIQLISMMTDMAKRGSRGNAPMTGDFDRHCISSQTGSERSEMLNSGRVHGSRGLPAAIWVFPTLVAMMLTTAPVSASLTYAPGFAWNRHSDWVAPPTSAKGTTNGNPAKDSVGNSTWSYEWVEGGGLGSNDPWYGNTATLMTWDDSWFHGSNGVWSRGNDIVPDIDGDVLTHNYDSGNAQYIPLVRWTNPAGDSLRLLIQGDLTVQWKGSGTRGKRCRCSRGVC